MAGPTADCESSRVAGASPTQPDEVESQSSLPVPHRLAVVYLSSPLAVWLLGYFHWWFGVPLVAFLAASLWKSMAGRWFFGLPVSIWPVLAISVLFVALSPAGNMVALGNIDWPKHRGIFTDLVESDWPARTVVDENGGRAGGPYVRYYLGYYLIPAVTAKPFGLVALNWTVPLWTLLGLFLGGLVFVHGTRSKTAILLMVLLGTFAFFDFADSLKLLSNGLRYIGADDVLLTELGLTEEVRRSFYTENNLSLRLGYGPQHFLPALIGASLILSLTHIRGFHATQGVVLVCASLWSPYSALGLIFLTVGLVAQVGVRSFVTWQNLIVAPVLFLPVSAFMLSSGSVSVQSKWVWEILPVGTLVWMLPLMYSVTLLPSGLVLCASSGNVRRSPVFWATLLVFVISPIYLVESHFLHGNELYRNGTLPANIAFCYWIGLLLRWRFPRMVASHAIRDVVLVVVLLVMLFPGFHARAIQDVWAIADGGFYNYGANPIPIGQVLYGEMYWVSEWHPALDTVLSD